MTALIAAEWGLPDRAALGWFLLAWLGYGPLIQHLRSPGSITARLRAYGGPGCARCSTATTASPTRR